MKGLTFRRLPVIVGATLIAGLAAWTGVTHTTFFGQLVGSSGPTKCTGTLPPGTYSSIVVQSGACTINSSVVVTGGVTVDSNATLNDNGASVGGTISAGTNSNLFIAGSGGYANTNATVHGNIDTSGAHQVSITNTTVGGSNVTVQSTTTSTSITHNNISNNLSVLGNFGSTTVQFNSVGKNATCSNNAGFVGGGNTAGGKDTCN